LEDVTKEGKGEEEGVFKRCKISRSPVEKRGEEDLREILRELRWEK